MIDENLSVKDILEWYVWAGVDETLGEIPFALAQKTETETPLKPLPKVNDVVKTDATPQKSATIETRKATTDLAQDTLNARSNAHKLCAQATSIEELKKLVESFDGCALKLTANKTVFGGGNPQASIMLIGEAPGADEDRLGEPFVGRSGHLLDKIIQAVGLTRNDVYITNVLPWRPPGNRTPTTAEVAVCLPFLKRQIEIIQPKVLVLLGGSAANALLDNEDTISKLRGKWLDYPLSDTVQIPAMATFHPAYLLRNPAQKAKVWGDFLRLKLKFL